MMPKVKYKNVPITPLPKIIEIALALNFRSINSATIKITSSITLIFSSEAEKISLSNNPSISIDAPADPISATTAGLKAESTVCTPPTVRYL